MARAKVIGKTSEESKGHPPPRPPHLCFTGTRHHPPPVPSCTFCTLRELVNTCRDTSAPVLKLCPYFCK